MCIICYITLFILALVLGNVFSSFCGQNKMRSMMRHDMYAGWRFGELKWDSMHQVGLAITMLYVHFISLANQPHILRLFTVPSSLFFPLNQALSQPGSLKQDETITRQVILLLTMGCGQVVEAPVSLGSFRFPPHVLRVQDRDSHFGQ